MGLVLLPCSTSMPAVDTLPYKHDIEGAFEYIARHHLTGSKECSQLLLRILVASISSAPEPDRAKIAVHALLFKAWRQLDDSPRNYGLYLHRQRLQTPVYLELVLALKLESYLIQTLYTISPEVANPIFKEIADDDPRLIESVLSPWCTVTNSLPIDERNLAFVTMESIIIKHAPEISDPKSRFNVFDSLYHTILSELDKIDHLPLASATSSDITLPTSPNDVTSEIPSFIYEIGSVVTLVRTLDSLLFEHAWTAALKQSADHTAVVVGMVTRIMSRLKKIDHHEEPSLISFLRHVGSLQLDGKARIPEQIQMKKTRTDKLWKLLHTDAIDLRTLPQLPRELTRFTAIDESPIPHESALVIILRTIRHNLPPPESVLPTSSPASTMFDARMHESEWDILLGSPPHQGLTRQDVDVWRAWCVENVRVRGTGWSSLLKLMVQFADLFVSDLTAVDQFSTLIVSEGLVEDFIESIRRLAMLSDRTPQIVDASVIKMLCSLLLRTFSLLHTPNDRLLLRDYLYNSRSHTQDIHQPTFGSWTFWPADFHTQLMMSCNQLVAIEPTDDVLHYANAEDETNMRSHEKRENVVGDMGEDGGVAVEKLRELSLVSPYHVLRALCFEAIRNKGQCLMIASLLRRHLGKLAWLRSGDSVALLVMVLRDILVEMRNGGVHEMPDTDKAMEAGGKSNFVEFVVECMGLRSSVTITSLHLSAQDVGEWAHYSTTAVHLSRQRPCLLLDIREYFIQCIIPVLQYPVGQTPPCSLFPLKISLAILHQIFPTSTALWATPPFSSNDTHVPPALPMPRDSWFYGCRPLSFVHLLSVLLDHRRKERAESRKIGMRQWEDVVFVAKTVIKEAERYPTRLEEQKSHADLTEKLARDVTRKLYEKSRTLDWTVQLLLQSLFRESGLRFKFSVDAVLVPTPLVALCGDVNGSIVSESGNGWSAKTTDVARAMHQWISFAEACCVSNEWLTKLCECVTATQAIAGTVNQAIFPLALCHVLHPSSSSSVGEEYERLLIKLVSWLIEKDLLSANYLLREINVFQVVTEGPESEESVDSQVSLDEKHTAAIIAFSMRLLAVSSRSSLEYASTETQAQIDDGEEAYFVSNITKALKTLPPWSTRLSASDPSSTNSSPTFLTIAIYLLCRGITYVRSEKAADALFTLILQTLSSLTGGIIGYDGVGVDVNATGGVKPAQMSNKRKSQKKTKGKRVEANVAVRNVDSRDDGGSKMKSLLTGYQLALLQEAAASLKNLQHRAAMLQAIGFESFAETSSRTA